MYMLVDNFQSSKYNVVKHIVNKKDPIYDKGDFNILVVLPYFIDR